MATKRKQPTPRKAWPQRGFRWPDERLGELNKLIICRCGDNRSIQRLLEILVEEAIEVAVETAGP